MPKDETKHRHGRRKTHIMSQEEAKSGKESHWEELEITGSLISLIIVKYCFSKLLNRLTSQSPPPLTVLTMLLCNLLLCAGVILCLT